MDEEGLGAPFEATIRTRLETERRRLQRRIGELRPQLAPVAPDCALGRAGRIETQAYQAVRGRELEQLQVALHATEAALARLQAGRYGICTRCGEPIERARLLARPQSNLCADCAR